MTQDLPPFVRGTSDEVARATALRNGLVHRWSGTGIPRPVRLVLRGLTDARWWIAQQGCGPDGVADALRARLGPHAYLLAVDPPVRAGSPGPAGRSGVDPTDEQLAARDLFVAGNELALVAGAGTGKTSTLVLMAGAGTGKRRRWS